MSARKILIVDDVPAVRSLLKNVLADHVLSEAATGKQAIEMIKSDEPPELVLLDQSLDDKSGLDILSETIEIRESKKIKVVVVTGHRDRDTVIKALALGANDYVVKPIDIVALKSKIDTVFGGQSEKFATVKTRLAAQIKDFPMDVDLVITELSEAGLTFSSDFKFEPNKNIVLQSATLEEKIGTEGVMARINSVTKIKNGFSFAATFVGISDDVTQKIRKITLRGVEFKDEIELQSKF